jgi:hypothetical protein
MLNEKQLREKVLIEDIVEWPHFPFLPVKQWKDHKLTVGVITLFDLTKVYEVNLFDVLESKAEVLKDCTWTKYDSLEHMLLDGWIGD